MPIKIRQGKGSFSTPSGFVQVDFKSSPPKVQGENGLSLAYGLGLVQGYYFFDRVAVTLSLLKASLPDPFLTVRGAREASAFFQKILGPYLRQENLEKMDLGALGALNHFCEGFNALAKESPSFKEWASLSGKSSFQLSPMDVVLLHDLQGFWSWWETRWPRFRFLHSAMSTGVNQELLTELLGPDWTMPGPELSYVDLGTLNWDPGKFWKLVTRIRRGYSRRGSEQSGVRHYINAPWGEVSGGFFFVEMLLKDRKVQGMGIPGTPVLLHGQGKLFSWGGQPKSRGVVEPVLFHHEDGHYLGREGQFPLLRERDGGFRTQFGPVISNLRARGWALALHWARPTKSFETHWNLPFCTNLDQAKDLLISKDALPMDWILTDKQGKGYQLVSGLYFKSTFEEKLRIQGEDSQVPNFRDPKDFPFRSFDSEDSVVIHRMEDKSSGINVDTFGHWNMSLENPKDPLAQRTRDLYSPAAQGFLSMVRSFLPKKGPGSSLSEWDCRLVSHEVPVQEYFGMRSTILETLVRNKIRSNDFFRNLHSEDPSSYELMESWDAVLRKPSSLWWKGVDRDEVILRGIMQFSQGLLSPASPFSINTPLQEIWRDNHPMFRKPNLVYSWGRGSLDGLRSFWVEKRGDSRLPFGTILIFRPYHSQEIYQFLPGDPAFRQK